MWGILTERNERKGTKIITEPHELYRFLSTPGVELTNLEFASDDVWLYGMVCMVFSTGCRRTRFTVIMIVLYLFNRVPNRGRSHLATSWGICNLN